MPEAPSLPARERTLLPLVRAHSGGRSAMTCHFRCDDACSKPVPNTTGPRVLRRPRHARRLAAYRPQGRRPRRGRRRARHGRGYDARSRGPELHGCPRPRPGPRHEGAVRLHAHRAATRRPRPRRRPGRASPGRPIISWGDPIVAGRARLRLRRADRRGAGRPVRLQQRLRRPVQGRGRQLRHPRRQQRVHQRRADVPRLHRRRRADPGAAADQHGGPRDVGRGVAAQGSRPAMELRPRCTRQPADHRDQPLRRRRTRGRRPAAAHLGRPDRDGGARDLRQLRRRR